MFLEELLGDEKLTDLGNARRFVEQHRGGIRYCLPMHAYLIWDGRRWAIDDTGAADRLARETVGLFWHFAVLLSDKDERNACLKWAAESESARALRAMLQLARSEPGIPILPEELDAFPWLLNCRNGTLDLRTGTLHRHRREDLLTNVLRWEYDPAAKFPTWDRYLARVLRGDAELIRWIQKASGYCLSGESGEKLFFIVFGDNDSGKSTYIWAMQHLLGRLAMQASPDLLLVKKTDRPSYELARLKGIRFVGAVETDEGARLAEALVKQMTGDDEIVGRFPYGRAFSFQPTHKVWLATNDLPVVRGGDNAIWERITPIPFPDSIPEAERDRHLKAKLRREMPGILRWAVEGCLAWQAEGLRPLPKAIQDAKGVYRSRMDHVRRFLEERCEFLPVAMCTKKALFASFDGWRDAFKVCAPISRPAFNERVRALGRAKGVHDGPEHGKQKLPTWIGVQPILARLVTEEDPS